MAQNDINSLAENEAIFREINEDIKEWEKSEGSGKDYHTTFVEFYCECSDPGCKEKISITPAQYEEIHIRRKQFIVKKGHNIPSLEQVIEKKDDYAVVEKLVKPPEEPSGSMNII